LAQRDVLRLVVHVLLAAEGSYRDTEDTEDIEKE